MCSRMCEEERKQRRLSEDKTGRRGIKKFPDLGSWVAELYSLFLTDWETYQAPPVWRQRGD